MCPCEWHLYYAYFGQCLETFSLNLSPLARGDELTAASVGRATQQGVYLVYRGNGFRLACEKFLCFQAVHQSCRRQ